MHWCLGCCHFQLNFCLVSAEVPQYSLNHSNEVGSNSKPTLLQTTKTNTHIYADIHRFTSWWRLVFICPVQQFHRNPSIIFCFSSARPKLKKTNLAQTADAQVCASFGFCLLVVSGPALSCHLPRTWSRFITISKIVFLYWFTNFIILCFKCVWILVLIVFSLVSEAHRLHTQDQTKWCYGGARHEPKVPEGFGKMAFCICNIGSPGDRYFMFCCHFCWLEWRFEKFGAVN